MRHRNLIVVPFVAGLALMISSRIAAEDAPSREKINALIKQMGSNSFAERETASKELAAIGVPALEALRQAAKGEDAEVRKRAEEILPKIEMQAESMRVLAPKRIHLIYKDTPLNEAVADFQKKSGYIIQLHDPDGKLKERKLTLDTGETSFWHAFEMFCEKAVLTEASMEDLMRVPQGPGGIPGAPAAQPRVIRPRRASILGTNGQLILKDGKAKKWATDDRNAVRIRVLDKSELFGNVPDGEILLPLEVSLEPKLQWQTFQSIHIDKVVDDRGQKLAQVIPQVEGAAGALGGNMAIVLPGVGGGVKFQQGQVQMQFMVRQKIGWNGLSQLVPAQLKKGAKDANSLKELQGVLTAQLLTEARPAIASDKLDKAVGRTFKSAEGGSIKIEGFKSEEKQTTIQFQFEQPPYDKIMPAQPRVTPDTNAIGEQLRGLMAPGRDGFMNSFNGLSVQDDKGNALPIKTTLVNRMQQMPGGGLRQIMYYAIVCRHEKNKGQPARLVYLGRKRVTVEIPFVLKDVPLP